MGNILIENVKGEPFVRKALEKTIIRPDDMTELLSLWNTRHKGSMVPNAMRKAFKFALETKFDEYQFRKYAQPRAKVKLRDVVKLAHPSPKNFKDETIFKRVIEGNLKNIDTAQTINASKTGEERVQAYVEQIKSGTMGYMAAVKNIRTMIANGMTEDDLKAWSNFITDANRVKKSMLLPTRFLDGWNAVKELPMDEFTKKIVKKALERAFGISAGNTNIVEDGEKIALLLDESYSMNGKPFTIGTALSASMKVGLDDDKCLVYTWADKCRKRETDGLSPFDFIDSMNCQGGGTDVAAPFKELIRTKTNVDSIVIFTDEQMFGAWGNMGDQVKNYLAIYKKEVNPNVKVLFWNLAGYDGGSPIDLEKEQEVFECAGFSDKMLQVIPKLWHDKGFLIKEIDAVVL